MTTQKFIISLCFFLFVATLLESCDAPRRRNRRKPVEICKSASLCGDLKTKVTSKCSTSSSRQFSEREFFIENNHPNKVVEFLVEIYEQEMDENYPRSEPVFKESKIYKLEGKTKLDLGCEFIRFDSNYDTYWDKRIFKVVQKCFQEDLNCPVISNPVDRNPNPIFCERDCKDSSNPYCIYANICRGVSSVQFIGDEFLNLNKTLFKSNLSNDFIDLKAVSPNLFSRLCGFNSMVLKNRRVFMNGESCDIEIPILPTTKFENLYLRMPNSFEADIALNRNENAVIFSFDKEKNRSPIFYFTGKDSIGNYYEKEEIVKRMSLFRGQLTAEGVNGYCFNLEYCGRPIDED